MRQERSGSPVPAVRHAIIPARDKIGRPRCQAHGLESVLGGALDADIRPPSPTGIQFCKDAACPAVTRGIRSLRCLAGVIGDVVAACTTY